MAMTTQELEFQRKEKEKEARRLASMNQSALRQRAATLPPSPQSVRTPDELDNRLKPDWIARYRAAGEVLSDPNRTVEDVQRAVRTRVEEGRRIRGADDYANYKDLNYDIIDRSPYVDRTPPPAQRPTSTSLFKPPNVASLEERYAAQGIDPNEGRLEPGVLGFIKDTIDYRPGEGPLEYFRRKDAEISKATGINAPSGTRAGIRLGQTLADATKRLYQEKVAPKAGSFNESLENYAAGNGFAPNAAPLDLSGGSAPAPFADLGNRLNPSLAEQPVPKQPTTLLGNTGNTVGRDNVGNTGSTSTRSFYRSADGSVVSDTPFEGSTPYTPRSQLRAQRITPQQQTEYDNTDVYGLRGGGSGLRRDLPTSQRISSRNTAPTDDITQRYGYAQLRRPIDFSNVRNVGRVAGASEGGDTLRQITKIQERADRAYQKAIGRGLNSKAAARARDGILEQAGQLIDYNSNVLRNQSDIYQTDAYRERTAADQNYRQQMLGLEAATLQATSQKASDEYFDEWLTNYTSFPDEDGKYQPNPVAKARIQDMLGSYRGPGRTRIARAMIGLDSALQELSARTGRDFADWTEVIDMSPDGSMTIDAGRWTDLINTPGYTLDDFISELLPFGASGDILEGAKNGKRVRIPRSILEKTALNPRAHRYMYGEQDLRNR